MAGPTETVDHAPRPPAGAPPLARADWRFSQLENGLNLVAAIAIFGVMAFGVAQILSRSVSSWLHALIPAIPQIAIHGYIDYIEFIAVFYAVLGIAYCQRLGGHIRMEIVVASFRGRALWVMEALAVLVAVAVTVLLIIGTWDNFLNAWTKGDSSMDIKLQLWPSKLMVPVMLGVLLVRLLLQLWAYLRLVADPSRPAIGVPVPETPEQAARREIEEAIGKLGPGDAARG
jgi:TRAP-type C4-dicarboxylate transport system permease small subunit